MEPLTVAAFSHPLHDAAGRHSLLARLLTRDAQARTAGFLQRTGSELDAAAPGLHAVLAQWVDCPTTLADVQGYPLALAPFRQPTVDPVWAAASAALHLHLCGLDGEWDASFAQPAGLRIGAHLTSPVQRLAVTGRAGRLAVTLTAPDGSVGTFHVAAGTADTGAGWSPLPTAQLGERTVTLLDCGTRAALPIAGDDRYSPAPRPAIAATLEKTGALLQHYAPAFLAWVADADWAVVPIRNPAENMSGSLSSRGLPGVPFVSFPVAPVMAAELLVHETSHHYYHCVQLQAEPCNDADPQLYHSPYVKKDRPIDRILIAFHAFANIVLLYRTMLAADLDEGRDVAECAIAYNLPILERFSDALTRSPGLTPYGRALFEPLRDRLFA